MTRAKTPQVRLIGPESLDRFVELVADGATLSKAAEALGFDRRGFYEHRFDEGGRLTEYGQRVQAAMQQMHETHVDYLRGESIRRVEEGAIDERWGPDPESGEMVLLERRITRSPADVANAMRLLGLGTADTVKVEHGGTIANHVEVVVEHDYRSLIDGLERIGLLPPGARAAVESAPLALLPARPD